MLGKLGALASAVLGRNGPGQKKGRARNGSADDAELLALRAEVEDDVELQPMATPDAGASRRRRGAQVQKKRDREEDDAELVTPPPTNENDGRQVRSSSRRPDMRARVDELVVAKMHPDQRNAVIFGMYTAAQRMLEARGLERFPPKESEAQLQLIQVATGDATLTWDSIRRRVNRMRDKQTTARVPGSGRKTVITPELREEAKAASRQSAGDTSRTSMFYVVQAKIGERRMCSKATFMRMLNGREFKRRRVRYRPKLTEDHMRQRVAFAQHYLALDPDVLRRIVYVDEKRFEVVTGGTLTLPAEDTTPQRAVQSRTNPVYVMVLVAVMEPRGDFGGVVGRHAFLDDTFALRNSKNRGKGILEQKPVNVTGETYVKAWCRKERECISPRL
jgi:hypothetical protein